MRISDWSSDVCSSDLNIVITGSAFAGMVDEVPALSGIFIEGRAIHVVANRYITVSPNAVILGKGTQPAADIVISGILVSQDVRSEERRVGKRVCQYV